MILGPSAKMSRNTGSLDEERAKSSRYNCGDRPDPPLGLCQPPAHGDADGGACARDSPLPHAYADGGACARDSSLPHAYVAANFHRDGPTNHRSQPHGDTGAVRPTRQPATWDDVSRQPAAYGIL